jgi:hypothetical protein
MCTDPMALSRFTTVAASPPAITSFSVGTKSRVPPEDPDFLKPFEEKGEKLTLREGEAKSVNPTAVKTAGREQQKP